MFAWLSARLSERTSQAAIAVLLTAISTIAMQPAAWMPGALSLWLGIVPTLTPCLIAILVPEGMGATLVSMAAELKSFTPPPGTQVQPQLDPAQQSSGGAVVAILLAMLLSASALSACSSAPTADDVLTQANASVAEASHDLPKACSAVSGLHAAFEVAVAFSPEAAEQADTERAVYLGLTTAKGLCSPDTLANPPADVGGAVASVIKQSLQIQAMLKPAAESAVK